MLPPCLNSVPKLGGRARASDAALGAYPAVLALELAASLSFETQRIAAGATHIREIHLPLRRLAGGGAGGGAAATRCCAAQARAPSRIRVGRELVASRAAGQRQHALFGGHDALE